MLKTAGVLSYSDYLYLLALAANLSVITWCYLGDAWKGGFYDWLPIIVTASHTGILLDHFSRQLTSKAHYIVLGVHVLFSITCILYAVGK